MMISVMRAATVSSSLHGVDDAAQVVHGGQRVNDGEPRAHLAAVLARCHERDLVGEQLGGPGRVVRVFPTWPVEHEDAELWPYEKPDVVGSVDQLGALSGDGQGLLDGFAIG